MGDAMNTVQLGCAEAGTLLYEPEGLLLRSCLVPMGSDHAGHLLTFQLGYLGPGQVTVVVMVEGGAVDDESPATMPVVTTVRLWGTDLHVADLAAMAPPSPSVSLSYVSVPNTDVRYRYTILSTQAASDDETRGEIVTEVAGRVPLLTARTRADVTRRPIPTTSIAALARRPRPSCLVSPQRF
jgi:hypothetical protein